MKALLARLFHRSTDINEALAPATEPAADPPLLPGGWRPFAEAREFARGLGLRNRAEWTAYIKGRLPGREPLPADIPSCPNVDYLLDGFAGFEDWLGVAEEIETPVEEAEPVAPAAPKTHELAFYQALADVADTEILLFRLGKDRYVRAEAYDREAHGGNPVFHSVEPSAREAQHG